MNTYTATWFLNLMTSAAANIVILYVGYLLYLWTYTSVYRARRGAQPQFLEYTPVDALLQVLFFTISGFMIPRPASVPESLHGQWERILWSIAPGLLLVIGGFAVGAVGVTFFGTSYFEALGKWPALFMWDSFVGPHQLYPQIWAPLRLTAALITLLPLLGIIVGSFIFLIDVATTILQELGLLGDFMQRQMIRLTVILLVSHYIEPLVASYLYSIFVHACMIWFAILYTFIPQVYA